MGELIIPSSGLPLLPIPCVTLSTTINSGNKAHHEASHKGQQNTQGSVAQYICCVRCDFRNELLQQTQRGDGGHE